MLGEEVRWDQNDALCCFEEILEAAPNKTPVVQPFNSHLPNHSRKASKTCWSLQEKEGKTHKKLSPMDTSVLLTSKNLHSSTL